MKGTKVAPLAVEVLPEGFWVLAPVGHPSKVHLTGAVHTIYVIVPEERKKK